MQPLKLTLYTIGANNQRLLDLAKSYDIKAVSSHTLEKAIEHIDKALDADSVALLSPAAASFDQFTSYKHRGESFMDLIKKL